MTVRDVIMFQAGLGTLACALLCLMFALVYRRNRLIIIGLYLSITFAGLTVGFLSNILAVLVSYGNPCPTMTTYYVRAAGLGIAMSCILYGGIKLLLMNKVGSVHGDSGS